MWWLCWKIISSIFFHEKPFSIYLQINYPLKFKSWSTEISDWCNFSHFFHIRVDELWMVQFISEVYCNERGKFPPVLLNTEWKCIFKKYTKTRVDLNIQKKFKLFEGEKNVYTFILDVGNGKLSAFKWTYFICANICPILLNIGIFRKKRLHS